MSEFGDVVQIEVREQPIVALSELGRISIAFEVGRVLDVSSPRSGLGGIVLTERSLDRPYTIDHDAREGEGPARWPKRFDVSKWGLFFAFDGDKHVGGALIAFGTPNLFMLQGRRDIGALWDLRVDPLYRGRGVGYRLVAAAEGWAKARGCRRLKIETQNVNTAACDFYVRQGYVLDSIERSAYDDEWASDETKLVFIKDLVPEAGTAAG